jgi:hypothetical protein
MFKKLYSWWQKIKQQFIAWRKAQIMREVVVPHHTPSSSQQVMKNSTSFKKSPLKFFVLLFALSLPFWLLGAIAEHFSIGLPFNLPVSSLQAFFPLITALILVSREEQTGGRSRLLKRVFDLKRIKHKIWYVPILFLNPLIFLLSYWVMLLLGLPLPEPHIPSLLIPCKLGGAH